MAIEVDVEMLQLGDVIMIDLPDRGVSIEAQVVGESPEVVREIERSQSFVRARLRVAGRDLAHGDRVACEAQTSGALAQ